MMINRSFVDYIFPIPGNISSHDIWMFFCSSLLDKFYNTSEIITEYRIHEQNTSKISTEKQKLLKIMKAFFRKKEYHHRFYYLKEIRKNSVYRKINPLYRKEIEKAYSYYKYKKYFLYRFIHLVFFIKRFRYFSANAKRKPSQIYLLKSLLKTNGYLLSLLTAFLTFKIKLTNPYKRQSQRKSCVLRYSVCKFFILMDL